MSELKPFGGAGDPLVGDFSGELLVKRWRLDHPTNEEAEKAWEEADKLMKVPASDDTLPWFIAKYVEEKGTKFYWYRQNSIGASWECRDCIVLDQYEYFEKSNRTWEEQRVRNLGRFDELVKEKWLTEEEKPLFEQFVEFHPVRHDFEDFLKDWEIFKSRKATEEAVISR